MKFPWKAALLIAGLAVFIDYLFHYFFLPEMIENTVIAYRENALYFVSKFAIFAVVAFLFLITALMFQAGPRSFPGTLGPILYGLVASAAFGVFYYLYPAASIGTGSMPIALKLLWGGIHMGAGVIAAGLYTRQWKSVTIGIVILVASGITLVAFGPVLSAVYPAAPGGGGFGY